MGAGYSIIDGDVHISEERMKTIYSVYCKPNAYDLWKKQLEKQSEPSVTTNGNPTLQTQVDISSTIQ